jgi:hypothetical protein
MNPRFPLRPVLPLLGATALMLGAGCGGEPEDPDLQLPDTPAEAATRVEQVFAEAEPQAQETAAAASEAVRIGDYEKAVVALEALKARENVTLDQGLAVHGYMVSLESQLIHAAEAGDEKARRAYELLRKMKRN